MQKPSILIKPTLETPYHIDYSWWDRSGDEDLRIYLLSHLPPDVRERVAHQEAGSVIDFIDPDTGEVQQLDELGRALQEAAKASDFINPYTSVVDSIFRVFIANGNKPMTALDLADAIGRPAATILKTLSGRQVYKGIRPFES
jgi:hypothetical protein